MKNALNLDRKFATILHNRELKIKLIYKNDILFCKATIKSKDGDIMNYYLKYDGILTLYFLIDLIKDDEEDYYNEI